jgi:hypothetical protein
MDRKNFYGRQLLPDEIKRRSLNMRINGNKNIRRTMLVTLIICVIAAGSAVAQKMHISATARGTSTQMGTVINVDIRVNELSTKEDQAALLEAFQSGGSEGLANALEKMKAKGRAAITGTLGYDLNYIRRFDMPDGSYKIRFITDRQILFREAWHSTRSMDYMLSMGEITISKDKKKTVGTVLPAAKMKINKEGELEVETYQNPWELVNIKLW